MGVQPASSAISYCSKDCNISETQEEKNTTTIKKTLLKDSQKFLKINYVLLRTYLDLDLGCCVKAELDEIGKQSTINSQEVLKFLHGLSERYPDLGSVQVELNELEVREDTEDIKTISPPTVGSHLKGLVCNQEYTLDPNSPITFPVQSFSAATPLPTSPFPPWITCLLKSKGHLRTIL